MDTTQGTYDKGGNLVCRMCAAQTAIAESERRASGSLISSAFGVLAGGLVSLTCFNPFFVLSIIVIASGIGWLSSIGRLPEYRARLGGMYGVCVAVVVLGIVFAVAPLGLMLVAGAVRAIHR
jgi:hypothetical protein